MARRKTAAEKQQKASAVNPTQVSEQQDLLTAIQTLKNADDELTVSKSELELLIAQLREQLAAQAGVQDLPIAAIERNPDQPRQTFEAEGMQKLACSLERDGQQEPIIVFRRGEGYIILDGERRWRCFKNRLNWAIIEAVIVPEPEDLHRQTLIATLHRQDINILDRSEAIATEVLRQPGMEGETTESLATMLNTVVVRLRKHKKISQLVTVINEGLEQQQAVLTQLEREGEFKRTEECLILQTLLSLQQNPATFSSTHLPALSMPSDLKEAVRQQGLTVTHANELAKINTEALPEVAKTKVRRLRSEALEKVLWGWDRDAANPQPLTVRETKTVVKTILQQHNSQRKKTAAETKAKSRIKAIRDFSIGDGTALKIETLEDYQSVLEAKLREVKAALAVRGD